MVFAYLRGMFIRRCKNKSSITYVVVVDKSSGKLCELKTIGVVTDETEIEMLERKAVDVTILGAAIIGVFILFASGWTGCLLSIVYSRR